MKKIHLLFLVISTIFFSCTKEPVDKTVYADIPAALLGKWNWFYSGGGIANIVITPQTTGETRAIEFDKNNNYKEYVNGSLKSESDYHIEKSKSIFSHDSVLLIIIKELWPSRLYFEFKSSDTLITYEEAFDGFEHRYIRIK